MVKKILKITLICFLVIIISLMVFVAVLIFDWQGMYALDHTFITIMGEEYFFKPGFFQHSEKAFRSVSAGITYEELVKKFGYGNAFNSNAIKSTLYYALSIDRFVVFKLVPFYTYENGVITEKKVVWRIFLCDDKEILEILSEDRGIYEAAIPTWDLALAGDKDTTN